jgi:hypothetical protein
LCGNEEIYNFNIYSSVEFFCSAAPFVSINSINATSEFPKVKVVVTVSERDGRAINSLDERNFQIYEDGYMVNYVRLKDLSATSELFILQWLLTQVKALAQIFLIKSNMKLALSYRFFKGR